MHFYWLWREHFSATSVMVCWGSCLQPPAYMLLYVFTALEHANSHVLCSANSCVTHHRVHTHPYVECPVECYKQNGAPPWLNGAISFGWCHRGWMVSLQLNVIAMLEWYHLGWKGTIWLNCTTLVGWCHLVWIVLQWLNSTTLVGSYYNGWMVPPCKFKTNCIHLNFRT